MKTSQKGFTVVEGLLTVIVIAAVAFGGYWVWRDHNKKDATKTAAPTTTPVSDTATDKAAALANIKAFYKGYLASSPMSSYLETAVTQNQLTSAGAKLITHNQGSDLPTCSQSPLTYDKYTFSEPTISGTTGTATVSGVYAGPPASTVKINLTLQKKNNKWAIDKISCPGL